MGIEFKAPEKIKNPNNWPSLFEAGAIDQGKSWNWQAELTKYLNDVPCIIMNPRRADWNSSWKQSIENKKFKEQVEWELQGMEKATIIAMCLTKDSKAPISLLELGLHAADGKMLVFCPEGFWRKGNVDVVCNRYGVKVYEDFDEFNEVVKEKMMKPNAIKKVGQVDRFVMASDKVAHRTMLRKFIVGMREADSDVPRLEMTQLQKEAGMNKLAVANELVRIAEELVADRWYDMPEGWDAGSREQFWDSLTGDTKHKITKCINEMKGKVSDPGAFCGALASRVGYR